MVQARQVSSRRRRSARAMTDDDALLALAAVDDDAFARLVGPHRARLRAHCYRMLGSVADSDDAMQDTLFRAWRSLTQFEGRSSIGTWLTAIATNVCLRMLEGRRRRGLPIDVSAHAQVGEPPGRPLAESVWIEPIPTELVDLADATPGPEARYTMRESIELAFSAALQHLPSQQRAVLLLRDVLGYSATETAGMLATSVPAANSALQRARSTLDGHRDTAGRAPARRDAGDVESMQLARRYTSAMQDADIDAVIALLTTDATWSMPPDATWYAGTEAITAFLGDHPLRFSWRHLPAHANGQLAIMCYRLDDDAIFRAHALDMFNIANDGRISAITAFRTTSVLARFQLPMTLPGDFSKADSQAAFR